MNYTIEIENLDYDPLARRSWPKPESVKAFILKRSEKKESSGKRKDR